jgi:hypothetical protein
MVPEPRSAEDKKLFGEQVSERQQSDIWESKILAYVSEKTAISVEEVLEKALDVKANIQQQREKLRVLDVLTPHGWTQAKERGYVTDTEGKVHRPRMYVRPGTLAEPLALGLAEVAAWDTLRIASWTESILPDGRRVWTQPMPEDALRNDV